MSSPCVCFLWVLRQKTQIKPKKNKNKKNKEKIKNNNYMSRIMIKPDNLHPLWRQRIQVAWVSTIIYTCCLSLGYCHPVNQSSSEPPLLHFKERTQRFVTFDPASEERVTAKDPSGSSHSTGSVCVFARSGLPVTSYLCPSWSQMWLASFRLIKQQRVCRIARSVRQEGFH